MLIDARARNVTSAAEVFANYRETRARLWAPAPRPEPAPPHTPPINNQPAEPKAVPPKSPTLPKSPDVFDVLDVLDSVAAAFGITREAVLNEVKEVVSVTRTDKRQTTVDDIKRAVCAHFGVSKLDIESDRRDWAVTIPRQIGMAIAKRLTRRPLGYIGGRFGGRDHSTVHHACKILAATIALAEQRLGDNATVEEWVAAVALARESMT